jgi:hypothetical protein
MTSADTVTEKHENARTVWVGVAHVKPKPGNQLLEGSPGAFVNGVTLATSEADFTQQLTRELETLNFETIEVFDVETLGERSSRRGLSDEFVELGQRAVVTGELLLDDFFSYQEAESEGDLG